ITMGVGTMAGFLIGRFTDISALIQLLTAVMVLVQALGQIAAVVLLRRRRDMVRPYRMWLYPLPLIVAGAGWIAVYLYSDANAPGLHPIELSLGWVALGVVLFLVWAKREKTWPFGPLPVEPNEVDAEIHLDEVRA
ncbi:hypothetical protein ACFFG1_15530, partial [Sinomonas atrocyanea]